MKRRKKKIKMNYGGIIMDFINGLDTYQEPRGNINQQTPGRIPTTNESLQANQIRSARAHADSENTLTRGLDMLGNLAITYGSSQMGGAMGGKDPKTPKGSTPAVGTDLPPPVSTPQNQAVPQNNTPMNMGSMESWMNLANSDPEGMQAFFGALGGIVPGGVPVEIEGDEVLGLPGGDTVEVKGPSHEQGGIDAKLPPGTDVFSDRIRIDGLTMADRKKKRSKKQIALEKQQEANIYDSLVRNALNRTMQVNDKEEEFDMNLQISAGEMLDAESGRPKAAMGIQVPYAPREKLSPDNYISWDPYLMANLPNRLDQQNTRHIKPLHQTTKRVSGPNPEPEGNLLLPKERLESERERTLREKRERQEKWQDGIDKFSETISGPGAPTFGDMLGMYGNLRQGRDALQNTREMRAGDTPNINPFENYGKDALRALEESKRGISGNRDNKLKDLESRRRAISSRNRNSARGINTMRGLDLAGDLQASMMEGNIIDQYFSQLSSANASIADAQMGIDQVVMGGEGQRDIEDRQDRAAFYSNLAQNKKDIAKGYSQTGKNLNEIKARGINANFLDNMAEHVSADIMTGEISLREGLTVVPDNQSKLSVFESSKGWEKLNMSEKEWSALKPSVKYKKIMEFMGAEETPKK